MKREELIESAARALAGHFGPEWDHVPRDKPARIEQNRYGNMIAHSQEDLLEAAEAALTAILEGLLKPSEEMITAGIIERHDQPCPEAWSLATRNIFVAMLSTLDDRSTGMGGEG